MRPRTVSSVIESMRTKLESLGSPMARFSNYSNIYALFRTIAATITEQDVRLDRTVDSFFISTSTGLDLEAKASDYGLSRLQGVGARGNVLVGGYTGALPKGTILTSPSQAHQFEVQSTVNVVGGIETSVGIVGLSPDPNSNLEQGSRLYNNSYPGASFIVGRYRDPISREAIGSLSGSRYQETDEELRIRLLRRISGEDSIVGTIDSIRSRLLRLPFLSRVFIQEHTPIPGYFTIYVDTGDSELLSKIGVEVDRVKSAGSSYLIRTLNQSSIAITVEVTARSTDLVDLSPSVRVAIGQYISTLGMGEQLLVNSLAGVVMSVPGVLRCRILNPLQDVIPPANSVISISNLDINLKSND